MSARKNRRRESDIDNLWPSPDNKISFCGKPNSRYGKNGVWHLINQNEFYTPDWPYLSPEADDLRYFLKI
jgi:hypothetical protein